jgi:hypothetical protein
MGESAATCLYRSTCWLQYTSGRLNYALLGRLFQRAVLYY